MNQEDLEKVQAEFLEIGLEVRRVCRENNIRYFMSGGTFLGAVRHQGFIPWDDDMDLAMPRADYEKFRKIAKEKLNPRYCFQDWHTDPKYPHPFGKVRKKGTHYVESKGCPLEEDGFYVDIFPVDYAPEEELERQKLAKRQVQLYRLKLMKSGCKPWMEGEKTVFIKRLGYLPYQIAACFLSQKKLIETYDSSVPMEKTNTVYEQTATSRMYYYPSKLYDQQKDYLFAGEMLTGCADADTYLGTLYGDYMQLPPPEQRENRHQIKVLDFGKF